MIQSAASFQYLQRGLARRTEVAGFFLQGFLGCRLREAPEVTTKKFFVAAQEFVNKDVADPVAKAEYMMALHAEVSSNRSTIQPRRFAEEHLKGRDRKAFVRHLEESQVPTTQIEKNTELIKSQLARTRWDFESGLALLGSPSSFEEHVTIERLQTGETLTQITDRLTRAG